MLSKVASSTIFWVFGMTRPGIELQSPRPLMNTLFIRPMAYRMSLMNLFLLVQHVLFILLGWFVRWEVSSLAAVCGVLVLAFLHSSRLAFSLGILSASIWCIHRVVLICPIFIIDMIQIKRTKNKCKTY